VANNQILASDNFASGSLAAGWTALAVLGYNSPQVAGSGPYYTEPTATSTDAIIYWSGLSWPKDQTSEVVMKSLTTEASTYITLAARINPANGAGYYVNWMNGTATLSCYNGSSTTLGTATGLTVAAGDVLALQAAGSCITLWQNGNRLISAGDATLTSGYPGYGQYTGVNVTHTQVSSWRGYNAVQTDGIWTKQGVVLSPNATDLSNTGYGIYEGCCIYDSNPVILTQYTNVYKLYFSAGAGGSQNSYYAESADLKTWSRQVAAVVTGYVEPTVIKVAGTYYLYCQSNSAQGTGPTALYTSTDGVTFAQQSTNVFQAAASGWDSTNIYVLKPITVIAGTWYALYGCATGTGLAGKVGLATSTDGAGAVWTRYASNPVILGAYPFPCWTRVNGTYYVWMQKCPPAILGGTGANGFDPNDCARYSTTDFKNWSGSVESIRHTQLFESINLPITNSAAAVGGVAPIQIFNVGNQAFMLHFVSNGDSESPIIAQVALATAPSSISQIVAYPEDAVTQLAVENFGEGAGSLPAPWSAVGSFPEMHIVAGSLAEPSTHDQANNGAAYVSAAFTRNQYSEITLQTLSNAANFLSPAVLMNTSTAACYYLPILGLLGSQGYNAQITYYSGSGNVTLGPAVGITPSVGDVLRLSVLSTPAGNVITLTQNGFVISQAVDENNNLTSGYPGWIGNQNAAGGNQISKFAAGTTNSLPAYSNNGSWLTVNINSSLRGSQSRHHRSKGGK